MHKCENCGTEFESKFCPNCGTPAPLEECPNCGTKLSPTDKFCPECGYALRVAGKQARSLDYARDDGRSDGRSDGKNEGRIGGRSERRIDARDDKKNNGRREKKAQNTPADATPTPVKKASASPVLIKFLSLLPYATATLFALFSVSLFLMFLGSVSSFMGFGTGNVYDYLAMGGDSGEGVDIFGEMVAAAMGGNTVSDLCIALIVFAAFGAVLAACALAFRLSVPLRVKKIGDLRVRSLLGGCIFLFYLVDFLLGCILCGTVSNEITSPGAAPICVLVFALFFGLCSAGALLLQKFSPKLFPAAVAESERRKAERRADLTPPVPPQKVEKPQKPDYTSPITVTDELNLSLTKYEKAKKLFIVLAALGIVIAALTWIFAAVIPYDTFSFPAHNNAEGNFHLLLGNTLAMLNNFFSGFGIYFSMLIGWPCSVVLYLILGGSIGAAYYKKKKLRPIQRPEQILSDKTLTITAIVFPIVLFVLNLILAVILYTEYGWETRSYIEVLDNGNTVQGWKTVRTSLGEYMRGAMVLNAIIIACYLIAEMAFYFGIRGKKWGIVALAYPQETAAYLARQKAYAQYRAEMQKYEVQLAYYEEGIAPPQRR